MTPEQLIRLESLRLADPKLGNPDMDAWVARAKTLESYITGSGQPEEAPSKPVMSVDPQARITPRVKGPAAK